MCEFYTQTLDSVCVWHHSCCYTVVSHVCYQCQIPMKKLNDPYSNSIHIVLEHLLLLGDQFLFILVCITLLRHFVLKYRIEDYVDILTELVDFENVFLFILVCITLRRHFVLKYRIEDYVDILTELVDFENVFLLYLCINVLLSRVLPY